MTLSPLTAFFQQMIDLALDWLNFNYWIQQTGGADNLLNNFAALFC